jgi:hypothetical protein
MQCHVTITPASKPGTPLQALRSHNMLKHQATQPAATPQPHTAGAVACYKGSGVAAGAAWRSTGRACASHGTDVMAPLALSFEVSASLGFRGKPQSGFIWLTGCLQLMTVHTSVLCS